MSTLRVPLYQIEQSAPRMTCCVTGATGYVAGAIIQRLLIAGHQVNATVRSPSKAGHLQVLPNAKENLKLFKADLLDPTSFDEALKDCTHVFHVASPFLLAAKNAKEAEDRLIKPAVSGVESVLGAVSRTPTVKTVVMTSSIVAMIGDNIEHGKDHAVNENDWDESASLDFLPYSYSKTLAEKRAWELAKQESGKWRLVTINPGFVLGPPLSLSGGESINFCKEMIQGKFKAVMPKLGVAYVDVEDVAASHVIAALNENAQGRYLCAAGSTDMISLIKETEELIEPKRTLVGRPAPKALLWVLCKVLGVMPWDQIQGGLNKVPLIDNSKIKRDLGIEFVPGAKSLADMAMAIEKMMKN